MLNYFLPILILIGVIVASFGLGCLLSKFLFYLEDKKEKKLRRQYPDYYTTQDTVIHLGAELLSLQEDYEYIPKEHIDTLVKNELYLLPKDRENNARQIEYWRQIIADHADEIKMKRVELDRTRQELEKLRNKYNIK